MDVANVIAVIFGILGFITGVYGLYYTKKSEKRQTDDEQRRHGYQNAANSINLAVSFMKGFHDLYNFDFSLQDIRLDIQEYLSNQTRENLSYLTSNSTTEPFLLTIKPKFFSVLNNSGETQQLDSASFIQKIMNWPSPSNDKIIYSFDTSPSQVIKDYNKSVNLDLLCNKFNSYFTVLSILEKNADIRLFDNEVISEIKKQLKLCLEAFYEASIAKERILKFPQMNSYTFSLESKKIDIILHDNILPMNIVDDFEKKIDALFKQLLETKDKLLGKT